MSSNVRIVKREGNEGLKDSQANQREKPDRLSAREVETTIKVETVHAVNPTTNTSSGKQTISTTTAASVRNLQFRQALSP